MAPARSKSSKDDEIIAQGIVSQRTPPWVTAPPHPFSLFPGWLWPPTRANREKDNHPQSAKSPLWEVVRGGEGFQIGDSVDLSTVEGVDGRMRYVLRIPADALTHFAMEAAKELFGEDALGRREDGQLNIIPVPLPRFWGDAAQPVIDFLIRGYGLEANSRLWFHWWDGRGNV